MATSASSGNNVGCILAVSVVQEWLKANGIVLGGIPTALMYLATLLTVVSGAEYLIKNWKYVDYRK